MSGVSFKRVQLQWRIQEGSMRAHERGQKRSGQRNFLQISLFPVSWEGSTNIFSGFVFQVDDPLWDGQN